MNSGAFPPMPELAPYDRFFLASSLALNQKGLPGHHVFIRLSLTGRLDLDRLRTRLARTLERHPVLAAGIGSTRLTRQPRWMAHAKDVRGNGHRPALPLETIDLTYEAHPDAERDAILRTAAQERQDPAKGPLLRLWVFHLGIESFDLVLRWPHYLMDLTSVERFLADIATERGGPPLSSGATVSQGVVRAIMAWGRGMWFLRQVNFLKGNRLKAAATGAPPTFEALHRSWTDAETAAIDAAARAACKPGPMLHTRWHIASLARAVDVVFARSGVHRREHYLISLPRRLDSFRRVAMTGNDLTIDTLVLHRDALTDPSAVDAALAAQFASHTRRRLDEAHAMTTAFPGRFPLPLYVWLLRRFRIFPRYSIGFTSYRADDWVDGFLGCGVEDVAVWGVPSSPPGIIASFCRFRGRLRLSLGYFTNVCSPATAADICGDLERQLGVSVGERTNAASAR